jgi:uncharacterized membrane protein YgcG
MQIDNSVIDLAKERAQFGFAALAQQLLQDADEKLLEQMQSSRSGGDQYAMLAARNFIQASSKTFLRRVDNQYRMLLDRAMQTMYVDLRAALSDINASTLTLIDDDTVNQQIEIDRLVMRVRDADDEHLRRLNIVIGHLHDEPEAKERENPFRPYLMARTLHQSLADLLSDEEARKRLFAALSDALVARVGGFYASIREVFETNGLRDALMAQKPIKQRDQDGNTILPGRFDLDAKVLPGLQRMLTMLSQQPRGGGATSASAGAAAQNAEQQGGSGGAGGVGSGGSGGGPQQGSRFTFGGGPGGGSSGPGGAGLSLAPQDAVISVQDFQNFVRGIFNVAGGSTAAGQFAAGQFADAGAQTTATTGLVQPHAEPALQVASESLISRLNQYQEQAARGESVDQQLTPEQNQLFALGEQLGTDHVTQLERVAIDVVAMLFELILNDEKIPQSLRAQIGRLQIPFLKAAMLTPDMLQQTRHPARQLVNRLGSAAVALDLSSSTGQKVEAEINRIVTRILTEFDDDVSIFTDSLFELERFLTDNLRHANSETEQNVKVLEEIEQKVVQEKRRKRSKRSSVEAPDWLKEFPVDPRAVEFIVKTWMRVIEQEVIVAENPTAPRVYRNLLPDLVWSVQDKASQEERNALVGMLPTLAKRLRDGVALLQMPEDDARNALDKLVAVHTRVLRTNMEGVEPSQYNLNQLRERFAQLSIGPELSGPPDLVESKEMQNELAKRGVDIDLDLERGSPQTFESDAEWLSRMQVGTLVERWSDTGYQPARLTWISKRQTLYMFQLDGKTAPVVYSAISLIKSLREGSVRLAEHAPVFERAVESLIIGARTVESNTDV